MNFAVLTPSRGRPERFSEMALSALNISEGSVEVILGLDDDDPKKHDYIQKATWDEYHTGLRVSLSEWTNKLAGLVLQREFPPEYLISMGDDHVVQTYDWHKKLRDSIKKMDGPGFAYGDDLMNGSGLCTSWMVSSEIVKALGWMMLPKCQHMYVDTAIMELGEATGRIAHVPEVIIEHRHPNIDKAEIDQTYKDNNNAEQYERDLIGFRQWRYGPAFRRDTNKILELKYV